MTRTDVHDFLLCREFFQIKAPVTDRTKIQDFSRCFLLKEIPPLRLLQVLGCGLSTPYLFHIKAKTYSKNYYTMLWNSCFQTHLAFTFQIQWLLNVSIWCQKRRPRSRSTRPRCRPWPHGREVLKLSIVWWTRCAFGCRSIIKIRVEAYFIVIKAILCCFMSVIETAKKLSRSSGFEKCLIHLKRF